MKEEAQKLIDFLREQAEQKKRAEEKDKRHKAAGDRAAGAPERGRPDALAR